MVLKISVPNIKPIIRRKPAPTIVKIACVIPVSGATYEAPIAPRITPNKPPII